MKPITLLISICICVFSCGCLNIANRMDDDWKIRHVYSCTCDCAEAIALPFQKKLHGEAGVVQSICTMFLPLFIIDFPFEAVSDTVCLPWDIYRSCQNNKHDVPPDTPEVVEEVK
jgi:uncharacterized protein YceK